MLNEEGSDAIATIEWMTAAAKGRKAPPPGPQYIAPVRFGVWRGDLPEEAVFSLVLECLQPIDESHWKARIKFLAEDAPRQLVSQGATFECYEGRSCVLRGTVIDVSGN
jgi:hypothetical protein